MRYAFVFMFMVATNPIDDFMQPGGRTRVVAHRGFSGVAPENTMAAFQRAIDAGADMFELDVLLSKEGRVVVIHDDTLDRTTDGEGPVSARTLEELRALDAGSWFAAEFAGERIPTLELAKDRILVNIEIKTEAVTDQADDGIVDKTLELVRRLDMMGQIVISSFDPRALAHARELEPGVKTASLENARLQEDLSPVEVMAGVASNGFNLSRQQVDESIVETCKPAGTSGGRLHGQ